MAITDISSEGIINLSGSEGHSPITAISDQINMTNIQVGDLVLIKLTKIQKSEFKAEIIRKIPPSKRLVLGVYFHNKNGSLISSTSKKHAKSYIVESLKQGSIIDGKFGFFKLKKSGKFSRTNKILKFYLFGDIAELSSYSKIATIEWKIRDQFPEDVKEEVQLIEKGENTKSEKNYFKKQFITIDPEDAKDLDDAIFIEEDPDPKNKDGFIIYVAIADVSYFVRFGSKIDLEAQKRGNSTYFPDKVIPMLPEALSNNLCSLKERLLKRCVIIKIVMDKDGNKLSHSFQRSFVKIKNNFSYTEFNKFLEKNPPNHKDYLIYRRAYKALKESNLLKNRLLLNIPEKKILIGNEAHEIKIFEKQQLKSNELIEFLMIIVNISVAKTLNEKSTKYISRIHPPLDDFAINELNHLLSLLSIKRLNKKAFSSKEINKIILKIEGSQQSNYLKQKVLSLLPKAIYFEKKGSHFGLNLKSYCHFTSPIRRYADLTVHRALSIALGWEKHSYQSTKTLEAICEKINQTERQSMFAERNSVDRYSAFFIANKNKPDYEAEIVGISKFFIFIKLKNFPIEGVISKREFTKNGSKKSFSNKSSTINSKNSNDLEGKRIRVKLNSAFPHNGTINFSI